MDQVEEHLRYTWKNFNELQRFAESKNALLFTANAGLFFGFSKFLTDGTSSFGLDKGVAFFSVMVTLCSILICLISFIPLTDEIFLKFFDKKSETDNFLFFGHIAKYKPDEHLNELKKQYGFKINSKNALQMAYAKQIIVNSRLTAKKFNCFKIAVYSTLLSIVVPFIDLLVNYLKGLK